MKRILLLTLAWLALESSYAQNKTHSLNFDSEPITKTGIQLPQLITIDLNRSTLKFKVNLSEGLKNPNLTANYEKFISDSSKQLSFFGGVGIYQSISLTKNDNRDFYNLNAMSTYLGADLKFYTKKDYYIQIGMNNSFHKIGSLSDFDLVNRSNNITLGIGKGRINRVNDGASAVATINKLTKYGLLSRDLIEEEYLLLTQKIRELKNRRSLTNRSYPLTEPEEIQDLLIGFGVLSEGINVLEIIDEVYKIEPIFERTTGKQFSVTATGFYNTVNNGLGYSAFGLRSNISYSIHMPLNEKWQYNRSTNLYITATEDNVSRTEPLENKLTRAGVSFTNDFHYLVDTKMSYSITSTVGYDFINKPRTLLIFGDPLNEPNGFYLNLGGEMKYQINRTMSTTFGIDLNFTPNHNYTGLHLGLNF